MEKQDQTLPPPAAASAKRTNRQGLVALLALVLFISQATLYFRPALQPTFPSLSRKPSATCAQVPPIHPPSHLSTGVLDTKARLIDWHAGAVRIPTEVYDEMGAPGADSRWEVFESFHKYLVVSYPKVHAVLKRSTVDTWGLVYEWQGSDASLKPLMITGHQDVVPVLKDTVYQWHQPPFSGYYDGTYIWGRGAGDDKSTVTSVLAAIELLLEQGEFKPARTIVLGFGHDEERGGMRGAPAIRDFILDKYGKDSMALLLDEGGGIGETWGQTFGLPSVSEKGKYDLNMTVATLGGHSSVPPKHTGIGLSALLIAALEAHPHEVSLGTESPTWGFLQCSAEHAPDMPKSLKKLVVRAVKGCKKAFAAIPQEFIETGLGEHAVGPGMGNFIEALLGTTQATDMINGGVKSNALPEVVTTVVNHRVNSESSIKQLNEHIYETLKPVALKLNLAIEGFGRSDAPPHSRGTVHLGGCSFSEPLEPAPISPSAPSHPAWRLLAGTARGVWSTRPSANASLGAKDELVMAPFLGTGNTDTRRYWDLTRNIYRWTYLTEDDAQGGHTVNERISADALVEYTRFMQALILNVDADRSI